MVSAPKAGLRSPEVRGRIALLGQLLVDQLRQVPVASSLWHAREGSSWHEFVEKYRI